MIVEKGLQRLEDAITVEYVDRYFALDAVAKRYLAKYWGAQVRLSQYIIMIIKY